MPARPRGSLRKKEGERIYPAAPVPTTVYEGRIYHRGRLVKAELGVGEEGRIVAVAKQVRGGKRVDLGDLVLLPSAVDPHVHFRDPGPPGEVEDLGSGTLQAALGGVGAVVDMPNTVPPLTSTDLLEEKRDRIRSRAVIDVLPYAALVSAAQAERVAKVASGFKLFLSPTTGVEGFDPEGDAGALLAAVDRTGLPLHVHAEDPRKFGHLVPQSTDQWDALRPVASELSAIESLTAHPPSLRLHIAHATSAETARRALEIGACTEATPHHLLLSANQFGDGFQKVNPPLRPESVRKSLWEAFCTGKIPLLASDHAPHSATRKCLPFPEAPSGVPGVEVMIPLFLELVRRGELELSVLINACAWRPSLFLGLPRGLLEPGYEANFVVMDFRERKKVRASALHAPCGWTPYEGREAVFPRSHYLRGELLVDGGEFVGVSHGQPLRPRLRDPEAGLDRADRPEDHSGFLQGRSPAPR